MAIKPIVLYFKTVTQMEPNWLVHECKLQQVSNVALMYA